MLNTLRRVAAPVALPAAAVLAISGTALLGGTAQANAVAIPTSIGTTATSLIDATPNSGPWSWVCSHIGKLIGPMGCR